MVSPRRSVRESPSQVRYVFKTGLTVFHPFSHILTSCFPISAFNTALNIFSHNKGLMFLSIFRMFTSTVPMEFF